METSTETKKEGEIMRKARLIALRITTYTGIFTITCTIWYFLIKFLLTVFKGD
jgi:hypothetical protein